MLRLNVWHSELMNYWKNIIQVPSTWISLFRQFKSNMKKVYEVNFLSVFMQWIFLSSLGVNVSPEWRRLSASVVHLKFKQSALNCTSTISINTSKNEWKKAVLNNLSFSLPLNLKVRILLYFQILYGLARIKNRYKCTINKLARLRSGYFLLARARKRVNQIASS